MPFALPQRGHWDKQVVTNEGVCEMQDPNNKAVTADVPRAHWLLKSTNSFLFLVSSVVVFSSWAFAYGVYVFLYVSGKPNGEAVLNSSLLFVAICIVVATVAVPSSVFLLVAMVWYWALFDDSPRALKTVWLILFLLLAWFAAGAYYFFVYRRQVVVSGLREAKT
jgi:ABC-type sulfate transport system permease subunit